MNVDALHAPIPDRDLLGLARTVLLGEGFEVELFDGEVPLLLAENKYFVVGVAATATIRDMIQVEGPAVHTLTERMSSADAGPKLWDAYLVLLTQERSPDAGSVTRELYQINYDTSRLRRLAHTGVPGSVAGVRTALTPFVRPITLDSQTVHVDPFESMIASLSRQGVDRELAARAVDAFRQGGDVGDAF